MDADLLAWAPYLIGTVAFLSFPIGRRLLKLILLAALAIVALLAFSEPEF